MVMDKRSENFAYIRSSLSLPIAPLQYLVNTPIQFIHYLGNMISTQDYLIKENNQLKADQLWLRSQLQRLMAIESENNYLKSLQQFSKQVKGRSLVSELLNVDTEPFMHQVILDKGSIDKVYLGQPVLDANGVMGQVIEVGPTTSRVLLISDPRSGIAVQNARNGIRAIAGGDSYSDKLHLMYIAKTADIKMGDIFLTSGLGDRYPEGYPVGKVISIIKDTGEQFATITLQPSAHLTSSRQVLLIWVEQHA